MSTDQTRWLQRSKPANQCAVEFKTLGNFRNLVHVVVPKEGLWSNALWPVLECKAIKTVHLDVRILLLEDAHNFSTLTAVNRQCRENSAHKCSSWLGRHWASSIAQLLGMYVAWLSHKETRLSSTKHFWTCASASSVTSYWLYTVP